FAELPGVFKKALYFGTGDTAIEVKFGTNGERERVAKPFEGLVPQMQRLYEQTESEFTRNRIRAFMTRVPCKVCKGARLRPEILAVTINSTWNGSAPGVAAPARGRGAGTRKGIAGAAAAACSPQL